MTLKDLRRSLECADLRGGTDLPVFFAKRKHRGHKTKYEVGEPINVVSVTLDHDKERVLINVEDLSV